MRKFGMLLTMLAAMVIAMPGCGGGDDKKKDDGKAKSKADAGTKAGDKGTE